MAVEIKYNKHQIYEILKNYHWMIKEIKMIDYELSKVEFRGTQQWGLEATLPTGKGIVGKALENEVVRRSEKSERMYEYINQVNFIHERRQRITDEKEKVVLDRMLDGMSLAAIARHMRLSRKHVHKIQGVIVDKLVDK